MSEEWDSVTKIGSRVRTGGAAPREKVIRGESALNAARRQGASISTEKKFGSTNMKGGTEGSHLTKVDRSDDIIKPKTVGTAVGDAIKKARADKLVDGKGMTQGELAKRINQPPRVVQDYERGTAPPDQKILNDMEKQLGVHLRGTKIGQKKERVFKRNQNAAQ